MMRSQFVPAYGKLQLQVDFTGTKVPWSVQPGAAQLVPSGSQLFALVSLTAALEESIHLQDWLLALQCNSDKSMHIHSLS